MWMQITAGSVTGAFGKSARYWAEGMLDEGRRQFYHGRSDAEKRYPNLRRGRDLAAARIGELEAEHLVLTRPQGVLANTAPSSLPVPHAHFAGSEFAKATRQAEANLKLSLSPGSFAGGGASSNEG